MVDLMSIVSSAKGVGYNVVVYGGIMVLIGFFIFMGYMWARDKKIYKYPVTAIQLKQNGAIKEINTLKGGIIQNRNGVSDFQIKIAGFKKKNLGFIPDLSLSDADDRLTFIASGDAKEWEQVKKKIITEKEYNVEVKGDDGKTRKEKVLVNLMLEPIPIDIKTATINNIQSIESLMDKNKLTAMKISIAAFVLMVFLQILFLFLTSK